MRNIDEITLEQFPPSGYAANRAAYGHMEPVRQTRYDIERKEPQGDEYVRAVADAVLIIPKQNS